MKRKKIITYISKRQEAKPTADYIIKKITENPNINTVELHARGKLINRAVDVLEIIKRELNIGEADIKTDTEQLENKNGLSQNISKIIISLTK